VTPLCWVKLALGIAEISSPLLDEIGIGAAIALTLLGTIVHAYLPRLRMTAEEDAKDSKLSNRDVKRRITFYSHCARFTTLVGLLVLVIVIIDFVR
jgi:hypothetical protein